MTANQEQTDQLIKSIEDLCFVIDNLKNQVPQNNSQILTDIFLSLKEIGNGHTNDGCLRQIHHELKILNKTLIMSALLISATKNPEKTLNKYHEIIDQYLN